MFRKTYVIPTYNKALVAKDLPKEEQKCKELEKQLIKTKEWLDMTLNAVKLENQFACANQDRENLTSQIIQSQISCKLALVQKDAFLIQENSSKKDSKIMSLKAELEHIKSKLASKINKLKLLKSDITSAELAWPRFAIIRDMNEANKHITSCCQTHPASPTWLFKIIVSKRSRSGKTNLVANLVLSNKGKCIYKEKKSGRRYISCDDLIVCKYHPNVAK
ncbi:9593_t:CDS:2 [Cetraspora pellucida]|uniref:9593_t:CDS:1 n=1 Tax=Cetraspora pellucida TaxID=1433469 RepID=A0A9N9EZ40_9GLOM|nr:9593_t:CDS:2 [Cetraspora pellucida]